MLRRLSSPSVSMLFVPAMNASLARSVLSRGPFTLKSAGLVPLASGPADLSRSSWSAAASSVACLVMSVSSCMCSSCSMSFMDSLMRRPPSVVAATTGRASRETRRVLMRQLRRAIREPVEVGSLALTGAA